MVRVLLAGILAMVISIVIGPKFIEALRRRAYGQQIREEGPAHHFAKQGTPTMGGLLILAATIIPFLLLSEYTAEALTVFGVTLACGAIGFIDDFTKISHQRSLGLAGRWKMLLLLAITFFVAWVIEREEVGTTVYLPAAGELDLKWVFYALLFVILAGAANGVNLTDGVDGLAAGTGIIALFTLTAIAVLTYLRAGQDAFPGLAPTRDVYLDLAIFGAALIGGIIGFLWYNAFPAEVQMGDTGSMAIGGAVGAFAVMTDTELLLLLIGGIFLIEALSVMLQVFTFKYMGRRVLLMAPLHHHFEMKAWSETKIMVRFWILAAILGAGAFAVYYRFFAGFTG